MKVVVQDLATLRALMPLELAAYLRANGWRQEADLGGKGGLWLFQSSDGREYDVTLPARRDLERIPLTFTCSLRERKSWCIPAR